MNDEPTFDPAAFEMLKTSVGGDAAFLASLIADYLDDAEQHIETMRQAVEERNAALLQRTAHSLKSTSQTMGAMALAAVSRKIEAHAHHDRFDEAAAHVTTADHHFDAVCSMLRDQQTALEGTC